MVKDFNIRIFPQLYIDSSEKMQRGPCKGDPSYKNFFRLQPNILHWNIFTALKVCLLNLHLSTSVMFIVFLTCGR